jgi:type IV pilus assembly protein PilW
MTTQNRLPAAQLGLSLVELMVALTIGLFLLTGLSLIFVNSSQANRELQKTSEQIENGRYATELLSQELRLAGFYGHFHELPSAPGTPDPCLVPTSPADLTTMETALGMPVQGFRAADLSTRANVSATTCDDKGLLTNANLRAGSDVLVIRRAHTNVLPPAGPAVTNEIYIQGTGNQADLQLGNSIGTMVANETADGSPLVLKTHTGNPAPIRKLHVHVYFVAPCSVGSGTTSVNGETISGVCTNGDDSIPTLKRLELREFSGSTTMTIVPLVEGIEYFKVEYGIDSTPATADITTGLPGDATVDSYATTPGNWTQVIAAKVYVLARNSTPTAGHVDSKSYLLGTAPGVAGTNLVSATNDNYRRHTYTAAVRLMNTSGRREIP